MQHIVGSSLWTPSLESTVEIAPHRLRTRAGTKMPTSKNQWIGAVFVLSTEAYWAFQWKRCDRNLQVEPSWSWNTNNNSKSMCKEECSRRWPGFYVFNVLQSPFQRWDAKSWKRLPMAPWRCMARMSTLLPYTPVVLDLTSLVGVCGYVSQAESGVAQNLHVQVRKRSFLQFPCLFSTEVDILLTKLLQHLAGLFLLYCLLSVSSLFFTALLLLCICGMQVTGCECLFHGIKNMCPCVGQNSAIFVLSRSRWVPKARALSCLGWVSQYTRFLPMHLPRWVLRRWQAMYRYAERSSFWYDIASQVVAIYVCDFKIFLKGCRFCDPWLRCCQGYVTLRVPIHEPHISSTQFSGLPLPRFPAKIHLKLIYTMHSGYMKEVPACMHIRASLDGKWAYKYLKTACSCGSFGFWVAPHPICCCHVR